MTRDGDGMPIHSIREGSSECHAERHVYMVWSSTIDLACSFFSSSCVKTLLNMLEFSHG